ncbi:TDT family transporter [Methanobrevibacter thaueri]|uniref:Potassium-tellurite ethidium and proflavin transporter n=1 Tax=Methanobrevibacter thaueri TaxID=190975 RepID=A0A315XLX4_9EURY|nr:TDT family transporter [Methanobrevibacter thaueri]PWB87387.1 potassium-tellurite ethidium and proflavin transporter [Methanobrevibacter thaueri]
MNIVKKLPLPASGLILALFSLGNLVQDIHPYLRYLFGGIGGIFLILILLKVIFYPKSIRQDFENPIILSSCGTFSMALMILSTYLKAFMPILSYGVWIIGVVLHILLMIYFTYRFVIREFDINTVYPTWWIVYVGITMAAITANVHGIHEADFTFFIIGFISMLVTTPVIFYRYIRYPNKTDMNKPLICIFTALFSILIVGYLNSAESISNEFLMILYTFACIFYIFSLYKFIDYRNIDFYPSFAAFTFPFVISALATKGVVKNFAPNILLDNILTVETVIAVLLVAYVVMRYAKFLKNS